MYYPGTGADFGRISGPSKGCIVYRSGTGNLRHRFFGIRKDKFRLQ
jgi:hypothetical protein